MTRKAPSGARHAPCITHVAHDYTASGWLCITTNVENAAWPASNYVETPASIPDTPEHPAVVRIPRDMRPIDRQADMVAFADHLVHVAAAHAVTERSRPAAEPYPDGIGRYAASGYRAAADRDAIARLSADLTARRTGIPAPDTYAAAVAAVQPAPKVRKARTVKPTAVVAPEPVSFPDHALRPITAPGEHERSHGHIGWTRTLESGLAEVYTNGPAVIRAPVGNVMAGNYRLGRDWWPSGATYEPMWRPLTFDTVADAMAAEPAPVLDALTLCNACDVRAMEPDSPAGLCAECERDARAQTEPEPDPEPIAEPEPTAYTDPELVREVRRGPADVAVDMLAGPGWVLARSEAIAAGLIPAPEPEPASIAPEPAAPVLTVVQPDGRPTCERCGQVFRKHGTGAEWHRVNRPDCASTAARPSIAS